MLHPDPAQRPTLEEVAAHPWLFEGGKEAGVGVGVECYHAAAGCTPFLVPRWHGGWGLGEQKEEGGSSSAAGSAAGAGMEVDGPRPSGGGSPAQ